jgi:ABC-2 type transport system permease protein
MSVIDRLPHSNETRFALRPSARTEVIQVTIRNLRKFARQPAMVFFSFAMPIIMLTLFGQVFRSIADTPNFPKGVSYMDYLLPAVLCTTLVQSATSSATSIATDLESGMIDRFRSMPIHAWTVLLARNISDVLRGLVQSLIMLALGLAVFGFRFHGTIAESFSTVVVAVPLSFAMNGATSAVWKAVLIAAVLASVSIVGASLTYRRIDR